MSIKSFAIHAAAAAFAVYFHNASADKQLFLEKFVKQEHQLQDLFLKDLKEFSLEDLLNKVVNLAELQKEIDTEQQFIKSIEGEAMLPLQMERILLYNHLGAQTLLAKMIFEKITNEINTRLKVKFF